MKYTFILQSKQRYGAMRTFFSDFFPLPLYCSSLLANVWCLPPSIVHCKWTLALTIALAFALCSIFAHTHTYWKPFRIHQYQAAALMTFVSEIALVFLVQQFSPFSLAPFRYSALRFLADQLKLTKEKCQSRSRSILLGKWMFPHCERRKKIGVSMCVYDVGMRVCVWISVSL